MLDLTTPYRDHLATLTAAYHRVLADHHLDAIVLASGQAAPRCRFDDQSWPIAITPAFAHWLPLPEPDAFVVITAADRPRLIRVVTGDFWESTPTAESALFWDHFSVIEVPDLAAAAAALPRGRVALIGDRAPALDGVAANPPEVVAALEALRTRKSAYEIACLAEATERAVRGHRHVERLFAEHEVSELTCHLAYLAASAQSETDTPYQNIVARGPHAAVLHHTRYDKRAPGDGAAGSLTPDGLLVDAGARYLGYASDITRTWARGTTADAALFAGLVGAVDRLQQQLCAELRVGDAYEALHDRAHALLADALIELGIGRGGADALVERGVTRALFPHGLGHSLGLQVHDVGMRLRPPRPDNRFLRNTSVIEADQVFTIEPGCYIIDALVEPLRADDRRDLLDWDAVAALRPFGGVRIEDNVVVTATGARNLTRAAWSAA
ncbi:MAG: Xaa-Pro dipeptidase [Myxococcales bacterium]|nr:Xaa-Pro dipeptidase [Myxococcales bacterium]